MGGGEIMCQHGEDECFGNRLHNCAKQQMSPPEMSKFVVCMEEKLMSGMTAQDPQSMEPCLPRPDLSAQLTQCAAQHQGLLTASGEQTTNVAKATMAPFVTLGDDPDLAEYNIKGAQFRQNLCSEPGLEECCTAEYNVEIVDQRRLTLV